MPSPILRFTCVLCSAASRPTFVTTANVANQFTFPWVLRRSFVSLAFSIPRLLAGFSSGSRRRAAGTAAASLLRAGTAAAYLQRAAIEFKQRLGDARLSLGFAAKISVRVVLPRSLASGDFLCHDGGRWRPLFTRRSRTRVSGYAAMETPWFDVPSPDLVSPNEPHGEAILPHVSTLAQAEIWPPWANVETFARSW